MPQTDRVLETPGQRFVLLRTGAETSGEVLETEFTLEPGERLFAKHVHPRQEERFDVRRGTLDVTVGRRRVRLGPGERLGVPPGTAHTVRNPGGEPAVALVEWRPALAIEGFLRLLTRLADENRAVLGLPGPLAIAAWLAEHPGEFRFALVPAPVQEPVLRAAAAVARLRGSG